MSLLSPPPQSLMRSTPPLLDFIESIAGMSQYQVLVSQLLSEETSWFHGFQDYRH